MCIVNWQSIYEELFTLASLEAVKSADLAHRCLDVYLLLLHHINNHINMLV